MKFISIQDTESWTSIRAHLWLLVQPVVVGTLGVAYSMLLHALGITFAHEDKELIFIGPYAALAIFHSILAGILLTDVLKRHRGVSVCILQNDKDTFLIYRQVRLPGLSKVLLGIFSFFLVTGMSLMTFSLWWTGPVVVFALTFLLSAYWVVVTELEDPLTAAWFHHKAPREWIEEVTEAIAEARKPEPESG